MVFTCNATSICHPTCDNVMVSATCTRPNKAACVCPNGTLLNDGVCTQTCPGGCVDDTGSLRQVCMSWCLFECQPLHCSKEAYQLNWVWRNYNTHILLLACVDLNFIHVSSERHVVVTTGVQVSFSFTTQFNSSDDSEKISCERLQRWGGVQAIQMLRWAFQV